MAGAPPHSAPPDAVVVTGAAGFIGSHVCRALVDAGSSVLGVDNFDPFYDRALKERNVAAITAGPSGGGRFELLELDIRDRDELAAATRRHRPATIIHLAALAGVRPSIADPARYASVNIDGLVSVLDAARGAGCRDVLFASSSSVYGNNRKVPFAETDAVDEPISPYAATKRSGELLCRTYAHLFGLSIAAVRFFTVFGPRQRPDLAIAKFMARIAAGEPIEMFGDGSTSRDYTFVADIVSGIRAVRERVAEAEDGFCRIFNLGGSHPVRLEEMIAAIGRVVGRAPNVVRKPMQPGDVDRTWADLSRVRAELGWQPTTSFEAGLAAQWAAMQAGGVPA